VRALLRRPQTISTKQTPRKRIPCTAADRGWWIAENAGESRSESRSVGHPAPPRPVADFPRILPTAGLFRESRVNAAIDEPPPLWHLLGMLKTGLLNPSVLSLLARVRHTNTLVIADRGFPFWPEVETVDLSLVDDVPTVLQVLGAIRANFIVGQAYLAAEFQAHNTPAVQAAFANALAGVPVAFEPHVEFKRRIPSAIGLIRTGDTIQYANLVLVSA
jgi:D-ribose pyranase